MSMDPPIKSWRDGVRVQDSLIQHIRQLRKLEVSSTFITPKWPDDTYDPLLLPDMQFAVDRIVYALEHNERIGIVGDYDMDGTPAAAVVAQLLEVCGHDPMVVIPTRLEGYGFQPTFVDRFKSAGVRLIITVDCGIRDHESVAEAKKHGIDVIITDHHECGETLPEAVAVVNPKRTGSRYPFDGLCGTGVAFKLVQALAPRVAERYAIPPTWTAWLLDLVALSTIGDMVPLVNENRCFVIYGLKVLRKGHRIGLRRFCESIGLAVASITERDIAFKLIPKLNAAGRMQDMSTVYKLIMAKTAEEADAVIATILSFTTMSQGYVESMTRSAKTGLAGTADSVALFHDSQGHPGVTGLVAGRLVEELGIPVGIVVPAEGGVLRGSFRSPEGISLTPVLESVSQYLEKWGGHAQAAGVTVRPDALGPLQTALRDISLASRKETEWVSDGLIDPEHITVVGIDELDQLRPWGMEHPEPVWSMRHVIFKDVRWMGSAQEHVRGYLASPQGNVPAVMFRAKRYEPLITADSFIDICGTVAINEFRGKRDPQFMIKDIVSSEQP